MWTHFYLFTTSFFNMAMLESAKILCDMRGENIHKRKPAVSSLVHLH